MDSIRLKTNELQGKMYLTQTHKIGQLPFLSWASLGPSVLGVGGIITSLSASYVFSFSLSTFLTGHNLFPV